MVLTHLSSARLCHRIRRESFKRTSVTDNFSDKASVWSKLEILSTTSTLLIKQVSTTFFRRSSRETSLYVRKGEWSRKLVRQPSPLDSSPADIKERGGNEESSDLSLSLNQIFVAHSRISPGCSKRNYTFPLLNISKFLSFSLCFFQVLMKLVLVIGSSNLLNGFSGTPINSKFGSFLVLRMVVKWCSSSKCWEGTDGSLWK